MATAKALALILAKRGQDFGPALGPNQHVPSYMQQQPTSTNTPMNGTRPVATDVPKLPAVPSVPVLPGMPGAPISSPAASGSLPVAVPGPNKNVAQFAKSAETKVALDPVSAGVIGGAAGFSTEQLLKHLLHKHKKKPGAVVVEQKSVTVEPSPSVPDAKTAADVPVDQHVDPGFAKAMAQQKTRVDAQTAALAAKAKAVQPLGFKPNPIPGFGKNNSAKQADASCAAGTIKPEPKTNLKNPLPRAALMKTDTTKTAANPVTEFIQQLASKTGRGLATAGRGVTNTVNRFPKATGAVALGLGAPAAFMGAGKLINALSPAPAPAVDPTAWEKIKATGGDVLGKTTDYIKGFGQNPMNYDTSHLVGAGAAAIGAGMLLHHLLKSRKPSEPEAAYEG